MSQKLTFYLFLILFVFPFQHSSAPSRTVPSGSRAATTWTSTSASTATMAEAKRARTFQPSHPSCRTTLPSCWAFDKLILSLFFSCEVVRSVDRFYLLLFAFCHCHFFFALLPYTKYLVLSNLSLFAICISSLLLCFAFLLLLSQIVHNSFLFLLLSLLFSYLPPSLSQTYRTK